MNASDLGARAASARRGCAPATARPPAGRTGRPAARSPRPAPTRHRSVAGDSGHSRRNASTSARPRNHSASTAASRARRRRSARRPARPRRAAPRRRRTARRPPAPRRHRDRSGRLLAALRQPLRHGPVRPLQRAVDRRRACCPARPRSPAPRTRVRRAAAAPRAAGSAACCSAATNASSTASLLSYLPAGSRRVLPRTSGRGVIHGGLHQRWPVSSPSPAGGPRSTGMTRRARCSSCRRAGVGRDGEQPGPQRAAPLEPVEGLPGPQQGLLQRVLGVVQRAGHPVAVRQQPRPVRCHQLGEPRVACPAARGRVPRSRLTADVRTDLGQRRHDGRDGAPLVDAGLEPLEGGQLGNGAGPSDTARCTKVTPSSQRWVE